MRKKAILLGAFGFLLGALVGVIFMLASHASDISAAVPHLLIGGAWGAIAMSSSVVYDIEKWSIARATVTHFLFLFIGYSVLSLGMGWFRIGDAAFWIILAAMAAGYFMIWLFLYHSYKKQIRRMNRDLEKWKKTQKKD